MVTAGDFRNGVTFEMDGGVYSIIEFQHVKARQGRRFCAHQNPQRHHRRCNGENL